MLDEEEEGRDLPLDELPGGAVVVTVEGSADHVDLHGADGAEDATTRAEPDSAGRVGKPKRINRFDRPKPPHDWRWVVAGLGRVLISIGILMFGFVAYQLWGTALQTAAAQNRLENEFEDHAATLTTLPSIEDYLATLPDTPATTDPASTEVGTTEVGTTDATGTTTPTTDPTGVAPTTAPTTDPTGVTTPSTQPTTVPTLPPSTGPVPTIAPGVPAPASPIPTPEPAAAIAQLRIPSIGVDWTVVEGVSVRSLRQGPAHFAESPLPGQFGNSAIAGHRTTYGQPFWSINDISPGDEIVVDVLGAGTYYYVARDTQIIDPDDYAAVVPTYDPLKGTLTLVSCEPRFSTRKRLIVIADLDLTRGAVPTMPSEPGRSAGSTLPGEEVPETTVADTPAPTPVETAAPADTTGGTASAAGLRAGGGRVRGLSPTYQDDDDIAGGSEDVFSAGWFDDEGAWPHVAGRGIVLTAIALGAYWVSRKARRNWVGALVGILPFIVVLYFFYENVNRLLPPAL